MIQNAHFAGKGWIAPACGGVHIASAAGASKHKVTSDRKMSCSEDLRIVISIPCAN